ncbi:MAG: AbrB/MazE/SpoVT family DNA-binding domain-containing protein [Candidatus Dadabacteria bacterium]|nr:MAG: AbrB/MazE/SpoVT family DNA-binding domain-containing protein [Candidatus Dadabacteria bacterium]
MIARVSAEGRVTLPWGVRKKLRLEPGARVEVVVTDDGKIELIPLRGSVRDLKGVVPKPDKPVTLEEMESAIWEGASE